MISLITPIACLNWQSLPFEEFIKAHGMHIPQNGCHLVDKRSSLGRVNMAGVKHFISKVACRKRIGVKGIVLIQVKDFCDGIRVGVIK